AGDIYLEGNNIINGSSFSFTQGVISISVKVPTILSSGALTLDPGSGIVIMRGASDGLSWDFDTTPGTVTVTGIDGTTEIDFGAINVHHAPHDVGEMWIDTSTDVGTLIQNNWYEVNGFLDGDLLDTTHSDGDLTIDEAGYYGCHYSFSAIAGGVNKTFEFTLSVDDVPIEKCQQDKKFANQDLDSLGGHCILELATGQVVKLEFRNTTDGTDIAVTRANVHVHKMH
ncbi:unnamed protein product, partial [marine sediment metagenome]